jgi:hypothetical protein
MWHVDEGALHAYLDGALDEYPSGEAGRVREHLETCAECAARLADERRVRADAQAILGLAAPQVAVPTFEGLRAYVRAQAPRRTGAAARLYQLGWAASVVLALGTGWLLRGGAPLVVTSPEGRPAADDVTTSAPFGQETAQANASPREELQRSNEVDAGAAPPLPQTVAARPPAEERPSAAQELREFAGAPVQPPSAAGASPSVADAVDSDRAVAKADDAVEPDLVSLDAVVAGAPAPLPSPSAGMVGVRQDSSVRDSEPARRAAAVSPSDQRLTAAISAPAVAGGGAATAGTASLGRTAPADAATEAVTEDEAISLVVPGLEVLEVLRVAQEGTTFSGTRALQRLPSGDTIEVVHLPAGVDPTALPPLRAGWNELLRSRVSGWLVMRAPLPEASLAELLRRLEAGR